MDMPRLYAASLVCMYPSTASEPFGLTMLEALASAKPIVVTKTGGMPEIIKDGINGFIIPVKDFESLISFSHCTTFIQPGIKGQAWLHRTTDG